MAAIFGILPFLQALSAIASVWGLMHVTGTTDAVVTYGAAGDGAPSIAEWMNSFGALSIGVVGYLSTRFMPKPKGSTAELVLSFTAFIKSPKDAATIRRVAFAFADWLSEHYATGTNKTWWDETIANLRSQFAIEVPVTK